MPTAAEQIAINSSQSQLSSYFIDKMGIVSVKSFGAKGDGVTNDTNAIMAARDYAVAKNLKSLFFPHGAYLGDASLGNALSGLYLWGDNSTFVGVDISINQIGPNLTPGPTQFIELADAPKSFDTNGGKVIAVKMDESSLEFIDLKDTFYTESEVDAKDNSIQDRITNHVNGTSEKHTGKDLTLDPTGKTKITADDVQEAIDQIENEIKQFIDVNVDAEVGDAHISTVKSKTFEDIKARFEEAESQLAEKANQISGLQTNKADKTEINSLASDKADITYVDIKTAALASGSPKATFATLAALQADSGANTVDGKKCIYVVAADGNWYYWNGSAWTSGGTYQSTGIADNGVTPPLLLKSDYIVPTWVNILDTTKATNGYVNASGVITADTNWKNSDFIPVTPGTQYQIDLTANGGAKTFAYEGTVYDSNKTALSGIANIAMPTTWTAPANAAYVKLNYGTAYASQVFFKEIQNLLTKYPINWLNVNLDNLTEEVTSYIDGKGIISNDRITPPLLNKNDYYVDTWIDVLSRNTLVSDKFIDPSGIEQAGASWSHSDFIPIVAGTEYQVNLLSSTGTTNFSYEATVYDSSKAVIGTIQNIAMPTTWTAPANAAYVIVNFGTPYINSVYFKEVQGVLTKYEINWLNVKLASLDSDVVDYINKWNRWVGKKANFIGDSITYGATLTNPTTERYSALVKTGLGLSVENNYGINGTRLANNVLNSGSDDNNAMCIRYTSMDNDADIIFVMAGTNDYGSATTNGLDTAPFGVPTDSANSTFYGALHVLFKGLIEKYPGKTIVIITPIHRLGMVSGGYDHITVNPDTNKTLRDYVNAIREVAEIYGLHVLDLYKELNINPNIAYIKTTYMPDGLHPNAAGHQMVADAIINYVKRI